MKHTPGPWNFYDDSNDGKTNRIEIVATGKTVARIYHSVPAEDLPNARLIAAAPDLLEALSGIDVYLTDTLSGRVNPDPATYKQWLVDGIIEVRNRARAAIAKATGSAA